MNADHHSCFKECGQKQKTTLIYVTMNPQHPTAYFISDTAFFISSALSFHTHTVMLFITANKDCFWFCLFVLLQSCWPAEHHKAKDLHTCCYTSWALMFSLSSNHRAEYLPSISSCACPLYGRTRGCKLICNPLSSLSLFDVENKNTCKQHVRHWIL